MVCHLKSLRIPALEYYGPCVAGLCSSKTKDGRRNVPYLKLFQRGHYTNSKIISWVRIPVEIFNAAWKLSTLEKWCTEEYYLYQKGDYTNKYHNPNACPGFDSRWEWDVTNKKLYNSSRWYTFFALKKIRISVWISVFITHLCSVCSISLTS